MSGFELFAFDIENMGYTRTIKEKQAALDAEAKALDDVKKSLGATADETDAANKKDQEALDIARKQAEAQIAYSKAQDAAEDAGRGARNLGLAGKYGRNEGEKIWNEAQAAYGSLGKDYLDERKAMDAKTNTQDGLLAQVQTEAAVREKLKMLRDAEIAAAQRQSELEAEIQQQMVKQNEEASKALLMGSRKEQMEAAMIARFLQRRGGRGFSANEFMFLEKDTRDAIAKYFPDAAPAGAGTEMNNLRQEQAELPEIRRRLAEERAKAQAAYGDINPDDTARRYAGSNLPQQPAVPEIALNVGGVHIDIGDQFARLTTQFQNVVTQQIQPQLGKMSDRIAALERANAVNNGAARV
jgi:hypothetical protein